MQEIDGFIWSSKILCLHLLTICYIVDYKKERYNNYLTITL